MKYWKRLATGRYVDIGNMTVPDIDIKDIEVALNHIIRFDGHFKDKVPLTVAQHTLLCCNLASMLYGDTKIIKACLLHDFGEAYYGDISSPVKWFIGKEALNPLTKPIDKLIYRKFWEYPEEEPDPDTKDAVKVCDYLALDIERRSMWSSQFGKDKWPITPNTSLTLMDKQALFEEVSVQQYIKLGDYL